MNTSGKHTPESVNKHSGMIRPSIPQCHKNMTLLEVSEFLQKELDLFHKLEDMSDLNTLYQTGKQLSRLYFDVPHLRREASEILIENDFPSFSTKMMKKLNNMGVFKNDDIWFSSFYFYNVSWNFSDCNPQYATALSLAGLPHLLSLNIGHQPYLDNLSSKNVYYLIKASLSIMHNIVRVPGNAHHFVSDSVKKSLTLLTQREEEFIRCVSVLTLPYLVTEDDMDLIKNADLINNLIQFIDNASAVEKRKYSGFPIDELIASLFAMTVYDAISQQVAQSEAISRIKSLCTAHHFTEMEICTRLLWNLSFVAENRPILREKYDIVGLLEGVKLSLQQNGEQSVKATSNMKIIDRNIQGALWLLNDNMSMCTSNHVTPLTARKKTGIGGNISDQTNCVLSTAQQPQIYLSYDWNNKDVVFNIRDALQEQNLFCLTDDEQPFFVHSLESAISNLSNQKIFLICVSEAYKMSPNCRLEAENASRQRKIIIPLLMQYKYKPDGWLGNIIDGKCSFDFSGRKDFTSTLEQVVAALQKALEPSSPVEKESDTEGNPNHNDNLVSDGVDYSYPQDYTPNIAMTQSQLISPKHAVPLLFSYGGEGRIPYSAQPKVKVRPDVLEWSTEDVAHWLEAHLLSHVIHEFRGMDGKLLAQFLHLRQESPDYFYKSLDVKLRLTFTDILRFREAADSLLVEEEASQKP